MFPMACININTLPLQIFRRSVAENLPLIVVESDRPGARIECLNAAALERGVSLGMRYSEALSLCADLRAGVISAAERNAAVAEIAEVIARYSPALEAVPGSPGTFWVATAGLEQLFGANAQWADLVRTDLRRCGFTAVVVHGWTRLGTFVAALQQRPESAAPAGTAGSVGPNGTAGPSGPNGPLEERRWAYRQRLSLLPLSPRDRLRIIDQLGLTTIASLARISSTQLKTRFTPETVALHGFITRAEQLPIQAYQNQEPIRHEHHFESALRRTTQLVEACFTLLQQCSAVLKEEGQWITAVCVQLRDEEGRHYFERVRIAQPTRNLAMIERLLQLRLNGFRGSAVAWVALELETVAATHEAGSLGFESTAEVSAVPTAAVAPVSSAGAALNKARLGEAVALLQAEFGAAAVLMAEIVPHHLLERQVRWRECTPEDCRGVLVRQAPAAEVETAAMALVRRLSSEPQPISTAELVLSWGPFLISGEWWNAQSVERCVAVWLHRRGNFCWVARMRGSRRWQLYAYA